MITEEFMCENDPDDLLLLEMAEGNPDGRISLSIWEDRGTALVYLDKPTALRLANKILELFND